MNSRKRKNPETDSREEKNRGNIPSSISFAQYAGFSAQQTDQLPNDLALTNLLNNPWKNKSFPHLDDISFREELENTTTKSDLLFKITREILLLPTDLFIKKNNIFLIKDTMRNIFSQYFPDSKDLSNEDFIAKEKFKNEKIIFRHLMSMKLVMEIRKTNINFPYNKITLEEARNDFESLQEYSSSQIVTEETIERIFFGKKPILGMKTSDRYFNRSRLQASRQISGGVYQTPASIFFNDQKLFTEINNLMHTILNSRSATLSGNALYNSIKKFKMVTQFRPALTCTIIKLLKTKSKGEGEFKTFFDPFGGWGDRLVGFLAEEKSPTIVLSDLNESLLEPYKNMLVDLKKIPNESLIETQKRGYTEVKLNTGPLKIKIILGARSEALEIADMKFNGQYNDVILSCPPYYTRDNKPIDYYQSEQTEDFNDKEYGNYVKKMLLIVVYNGILSLRLGGFFAFVMLESMAENMMESLKSHKINSQLFLFPPIFLEKNGKERKNPECVFYGTRKQSFPFFSQPSMLPAAPSPPTVLSESLDFFLPQEQDILSILYDVYPEVKPEGMPALRGTKEGRKDTESSGEKQIIWTVDTLKYSLTGSSKTTVLDSPIADVDTGKRSRVV